jgi:hypothetical protein
MYKRTYTGCFKKSFTTILISNAGALAVAVLGTKVPRALKVSCIWTCSKSSSFHRYGCGMAHWTLA